MKCRFMRGADSAVWLVTLTAIAGARLQRMKKHLSAEVMVGEPPGIGTAQMSVGHLPSADLHGQPGDVGITDYRMKLARNVKLDDRLTLTLGGGYGLKHIDASSTGGPAPGSAWPYFSRRVPGTASTTRSFASLKLSPGFYSDFKDLGR